MAKDLDDMLRNVSVIGAGGKMGRGIAALMVVQMLRSRLRTKNQGVYRLNLMDLEHSYLNAALGYIEGEVSSWAERHINELRELYSNRDDIIDNEDHIEQFARDVRQLIVTGTSTEVIEGSSLVFEAMIEDEGLKIKVFSEVEELCGGDALYFTNTSSIPIQALDDGAGLDGRIIGYHFYNPPPKQRLLEIITSEDTDTALVGLAKELAQRLEKTVVESNDIAGFIGNGHFMRECIYAAEEVERLVAGGMGEAEAIYTVNEISRSYLQRPMGIFQLMDYVGLDVVQKILRVMDTHIGGETLSCGLVNSYLDNGVKGGQNPDGSQKSGFLTYKGLKPVGVHKEGEYAMFEDELEWFVRARDKILSEGVPKTSNIDDHFQALASLTSESAEIAKSYLRKSAEIAEFLVSSGVTDSADNVTAVLKTGFGHRYGPTEYAHLMDGG